MRKQDIGEPPLKLEENEIIAKVIQNRGNTFDVSVPESMQAKVEKQVNTTDSQLLVGLNPALRNSVFIRRNGFVVVSLESLGPNGKIKGEISNVITDVRDWQKTLAEWPVEFSTQKSEAQTLDLPPSLSDESSDESSGEYAEEEEEAEEAEAEAEQR